MQAAAAIVTLVYGVLVAAGGVAGWARARSRPSLIAGVLFGGALIILGALGLTGYAMAGPAAAVAGFLLVLMGIRFARKRKFMPAGLIVVLSGVALAVDLAALWSA